MLFFVSINKGLNNHEKIDTSAEKQEILKDFKPTSEKYAHLKDRDVAAELIKTLSNFSLSPF